MSKNAASIALKIGDPAPNFDLGIVGGTPDPALPERRARLADYKGRTLALYFYPKDDTTGCTDEAQQFSALAPEFEKAGCAILGVSKNTLAEHRKFITKRQVTIALGADDAGMCEAYGVYGEKSMYGRTYMGVMRATFLLDPKGRIAQIWPKVSVPGHAVAVLAAAQQLL